MRKLLLLLVLLTLPLSAATKYVSTTGSNAAAGDIGTPWLTVDYGVDHVVAGDTLIVGCGTYTEYVTVSSAHTGTSGAHVTFMSAAVGCAIIRGGADGSGTMNVRILDFFDNVNYWDTRGFDLKNATSGAVSIGDNVGPNTGFTFAELYVHDIGTTQCTTTGGGLVGFRSKPATSNVLIERSRFDNIGRLRPGESGPSGVCSPGNTNYRNHDHGVYLYGTNITIRSSTFTRFDNGWPVQLPCGSHSNTVSFNTFYATNPDRNGSVVLDIDCSAVPGDTQTNNTIVNNISIGKGSLVSGNRNCGDHVGTVIKNNVISAALVVTDESDVNFSGCSDYTLAGNQVSTTATYVNAGANDFHLQSGSNGIGDAITGFDAADYDNVSRPQGGTSDTGAFEFVSGADTTNPTVGGGGTLAFPFASATSVMITWTEGTDDTSAQTDLQYAVYRSASNNIGTVANAEANGILAAPYTADISSKVISGLTASTTYWLVVIVKDGAGNKAAYTQASKATLISTTPDVTNCRVDELSSRGVMMVWTTSVPCSTCSARIYFDFPATPGGAAPATLQNANSYTGCCSNVPTNIIRGSRMQTAIPGSELYAVCSSADTNHVNWSQPYVCTKTCTNCSAADDPYFGTSVNVPAFAGGSGFNCDAVGEFPYVSMPADPTLPETIAPPVHTGLTQAPAITGLSRTVAAGCADLKLQINSASTRAASLSTIEEIIIPPGEVCRAEKEASTAGTNLSSYPLPNANPGKVVIRSGADPKLLPPPKVQIDPSFYPYTGKIENNLVDLSDLDDSNYLMLGSTGGAGAGGYIFENISFYMPPLDQLTKKTMTVQSVDLTANTITVDDMTGIANNDLVVVKLGSSGVLNADGPARVCNKSGNTFKIERGKVLACTGTAVDLLGTGYTSGGIVSRWIAQPIASWNTSTSPIRLTVTGHGMGDYPNAPITGTGATPATQITVATNAGYQIGAWSSVWISGTNGANSATCNGLRVVSAVTGAGPVTLTLGTAGTNCTSVTTGNVRRMLGLSVFRTSDPDLGDLTPRAWYFNVIDANTLELPEIGAQGTVTTPGYIVWEPPLIGTLFSSPDDSLRQTDLTVDRVLIERPFPWRAADMFNMAGGVTRLQLVNSWMDTSFWWRLNKLSKPNCGVVGGVFCVDGIVQESTTGLSNQSLSDHQIRNSTSVGSNSFWNDAGVNFGGFDPDYTIEKLKMYRKDSFSAASPSSDGHLYHELYCLEIKGGPIRFNISGNYWKGCRTGDFAGNGAAVAWTDGGGSQPAGKAGIKDGRVEYNTIERSAGGFMFSNDNSHADSRPHMRERLRIAHNLLVDLDYTLNYTAQRTGVTSNGGVMLSFAGPSTQTEVTRNTLIHNRAQSPWEFNTAGLGLGSRMTNSDNIYGVTEGLGNTGYFVQPFQAIPTPSGGATAAFNATFKKGEVADPQSSMVRNTFVPITEFGSGNPATAKADPATASSLCWSEVNALANFQYTDMETSTTYDSAKSFIVGSHAVPCNESANTRLDSVFTAGTWAPKAPYTGRGADIAALEDAQGWIKNVLVTSNSNTQVTITWRCPNTLIGYVDVDSNVSTPFSNAATITRYTDAATAQNKTAVVSGRTQLTQYAYRVMCQDSEAPLRGLFTTSGTP